MNVSIELRSTMSPKVTNKSKKPLFKAKSPSILALKKNVRRSSLIKKTSHVAEEIIVIQSSSSSQSSDSDGDLFNNDKDIVKRDIINESYNISNNDEKEKKMLRNILRESNLRRLDEYNKNDTSQGNRRDKKHSEISRWVSEVQNSSSLTLFSEISTISGGSNPNFKKPGDRIAINSTFDNYLAPRMDELFVKKKQQNKSIDSCTNSTETPPNLQQEPIIIEDSFDSNLESNKSLVEEGLDKDEKNRSDVENKNNLNKPKLQTNEDKDSYGSSFKLVIEEDSEKDKKSEEVYDNSNQDIEDMLDSLYGDSWRAKKDLVFSEPRQNKKQPIFKPPDVTASERKPTKIKNPYLESETAKSEKLLKNLQERRFIKALESPLIQNLKKICDSESDSENYPKYQPRTRLNFTDESSESNDDKKSLSSKSSDSSYSPVKTKKKTVAKTTKKTNRRDEKTKESTPKFNDDEDDEDWIPNESKLKRKTIGVCTFLESLSKMVPLSQCDPAARIFRNSFKKYRNELSERLFKLYNEKVFEKALPETTEITWNERLRGTAGRCRCKKITKSNGDIIRTAVIELSSKVLDSADRLRDTMIHEMCHAATWIVNQVSDGHGAFWKAWAYKAMKTFPELPPIERCHNYVLNAKYTYRCVKCGYSIARHSKSLDTARKRCGHCYGEFECLLNKVSKKGETKSVPTQKKAPTAFALFVKENYATYKSSQLKHGEVMKILGDKFAQMKVNQM